MRLARLFLAVGAISTAFIITSGLSFAKQEYTKKEKKPCTTCHVTAKSKELNEVGKYYEKKKTLDGAPAPK